MKGKIIKGISGFYYVDTAESGIYECKAKGIFRNRKIKPLVGDNVRIAIFDEEQKKGTVTDIEERKNELFRPAAANIDQALLVFAMKNPMPNFNLLDRFLAMAQLRDIPAVLCFNKADCIGTAERKKLAAVYGRCGAPVIFTSAAEGFGLDRLLAALKGRTSAAAGPSGVGKSSIINALQKEIRMEVGEVSRKIGRGKHTTRHSQLIRIEKGTYLMDTPGFGSLDLPGLTAENLKEFYTEFAPYEAGCRFRGCSHRREPDCAVRQAVAEGRVSKERYAGYAAIYEELKEQQKYERRKL